MNDIDILKLYFKGEELSEKISEYEKGTPAAYLIGEWEFFGDRYKLNRDCLIPRCDTERVVEKVLSKLKEGQSMADICSGSGCIGISSVKRVRNTTCVSVEISAKAIEAAKENAVINGVENRVEFINADLFRKPLGDRRFDIIVSNPPYITTADMEKLDEYVKKEPKLALDGGVDGMDFYSFIASEYKDNLTKDGVIIFEIGYDQEEKIKHTAELNGFKCTVTKDYSGNPRVALLEKI